MRFIRLPELPSQVWQRNFIPWQKTAKVDSDFLCPCSQNNLVKLVKILYQWQAGDLCFQRLHNPRTCSQAIHTNLLNEQALHLYGVYPCVRGSFGMLNKHSSKDLVAVLKMQPVIGFGRLLSSFGPWMVLDEKKDCLTHKVYRVAKVAMRFSTSGNNVSTTSVSFAEAWCRDIVSLIKRSKYASQGNFTSW